MRVILTFGKRTSTLIWVEQVNICGRLYFLFSEFLKKTQEVSHLERAAARVGGILAEIWLVSCYASCLADGDLQSK